MYEEVDLLEAERLHALRAYDILDSTPEDEFDHITQLAARVFDVPIALVTLVDADRQWIKAKVGLDVCQTNRDISFCTHAVTSDDVLEVCDATADPRFASNPLVTGEPFIRYYAGAPLLTPRGHRLGSLCIIDTKTRSPLDADAVALLKGLSRIVIEFFELRRTRVNGRVASLIGETTSDAIICAGIKGQITYWNRSAEAMFGWKAAEAIGQDFTLIIPGRMRKAHTVRMKRMSAEADPALFGKTVEILACCSDGSELPVELSLGMWSDTTTGLPAGFAAILRDVSARKASEAESQRTQALLDTVIEAMPTALFVKDAEHGRFALVNRAFELLTQQPREALLGKSDYDFFSHDQADVFVARDKAVLASTVVSTIEESLTRSDGTTRLLRTRKLAIDRNDEGQPRYLLGIAEDITERREAQTRLHHLASHDALTGLANRFAFSEHLSALLETRPHAPTGALLCLDLDRFKAVNDLFGHPLGDEVLVEVASRLKKVCGSDSFVARLGGDEFAVVCPSDKEGVQASNLARRVIQLIAQPIAVSGRVVHIGACIGIAIFPGQNLDPATLMRNADMALYRSKNLGRGLISFFDPGMDRMAHERRELEIDLRAAVSHHELYLDYQPIACLQTGTIIGFEALARWHHPTRGRVGPDIFIPIAEESGLIVELGAQMLRAATVEAARWTLPLKVAVNLSPVQFLHGDFALDVAVILKESGLEPSRLEIEVTEGLLIRDTARALDILQHLKALGCQISMDDFGTGYSSLSYFRMFPFDKIKIDQSFVREMGTSPPAMAIVHAVIGLGRGLGITVVAEGIETDEQLNALRIEGCNQAQGYHIARPGPITNFSEIISVGLDIQLDRQMA